MQDRCIGLRVHVPRPSRTAGETSTWGTQFDSVEWVLLVSFCHHGIVDVSDVQVDRGESTFYSFFQLLHDMNDIYIYIHIIYSLFIYIYTHDMNKYQNHQSSEGCDLRADGSDCPSLRAGLPQSKQ